MTGQRGRDLVLRMRDGGSWAVVAGLRARSIRLRAGLVEATTAESPGAWRALMAAAGRKSATVSGEGRFVNSASDALMRAAFFAQAAETFEIAAGGFGTLSGPFIVADLSWRGLHDDEAMFAVTLESAGAVGFSPAA